MFFVEILTLGSGPVVLIFLRIKEKLQYRTADTFPPLVPDAAWKIGCLRSPLLPTPVNFPPFGHSKLEPVSIKTIFRYLMELSLCLKLKFSIPYI